MKNKILKIFFYFCFVLCLFVTTGCKTIEESGKPFVQPDYTQQDIKNEEIKRIEEISQTELIHAFWRSCMLNEKSVIDEMAEKIMNACNESINEKNYLQAAYFANALKIQSHPLYSQLKYSSEELEKLSKTKIPSTPVNQNPVKLSRLIEGTVTVWVDKGVKVENGMGYADRITGSGFFISSDGIIVTNHHVISDLVDPKYEGYARLFVKLAGDSETRIPAKVIGWDSELDLALLKVEIEAPYVFALGSSMDMDAGDKVFCIGSPIGLERTLTSGIVSARERFLNSAGPIMQIDAAVNSGNSGGPCVDEKGNVQAIVFAGMQQMTGLNFAIPVEYLKAELPNLIAGGEFTHGWMEACGKTKKTSSESNGVELYYVMPGGKAFRAGLKEGDIITAVNDQKTADLETLQKKLCSIAARSIIKITYSRNEETKTATVYLSPRPSNPGFYIYKNDVLSNSFAAIFGMKLTRDTNGKKKFQVENVVKGSVADESGFSESDYIEIRDIEFNEDKSVVLAAIYAKKRKKGYLDMSMGIAAPLNSPNYF